MNTLLSLICIFVCILYTLYYYVIAILCLYLTALSSLLLSITVTCHHGLHLDAQYGQT